MKQQIPEEYFPDGTKVDEWFYETKVPTLEELGTPYILTDYGVQANDKLYTREIQQLIDKISEIGGGVLVVPAGTYRTGALFFKQGVNLYIAENGMLLGSDDIADYPVMDTRIEGEFCKYFSALINVDGVDGWTMCGPGTIDGNGLRSWKAFWLRREWNPQCTNKDEQRPRLVYISNSANVVVADLHLQNAHFWTNHVYRSHHVKFLGCHIFSPASPVKAPSTDAIDLDVCSDVLVKNCYMEVNDDAVVLKGGKGPFADTDEHNGANERIIVEDCEYGFCHGCLTLGSESIHNRNIILRRIQVSCGNNLLWLKMRPDTPQRYEYILVEQISGKIHNFMNINPWTQFFDLKGRKDIPKSYAEHITMRDCKCECDTYFNVIPQAEQYEITGLMLENLEIVARDTHFSTDGLHDVTVNNVQVYPLSLK